MEKTMGLDSGGHVLGSMTGKNKTDDGSGKTKLSVSAMLNISMFVEKWLLTGY